MRVAGGKHQDLDVVGHIDTIFANQKSIDGTFVIPAQVHWCRPALLRKPAEQIGGKIASGVFVLGLASAGKAFLVGFASMDLPKSFHAGNIIKKTAEIVGEVAVGALILHRQEARTPKR